MDYKYPLGILIRVGVLVTVSFVLVYVLIKTSWFFTPLVVALVLMVVVGELIYYLQRQYRELNNFLIAVKQGGFTASFNEEGSFRQLYHTFNAIIQSFQDLALEKESSYQFLKLLTENMRAGLICYDDKGEILAMNPAAKVFIGKPLLLNIDDLSGFQPVLAKTIESIPSGGSGVVKLKAKQGLEDVLVNKKLVVSDGQSQAIILMQPIQQHMEANELASWQKLTRVMRHEIMNSLTPIVGLSEAVHKALSNHRNKVLQGEEYQDVEESMEAIESRSKALMKFINAYKDFSQTPELHVTSFPVDQMFEHVGQLLKQRLDTQGVKLHIEAGKEQIQGDEQLLEGVIINLVKNALEAMAEGGNIYLKFNDGESTLSIADDGPGLPPDHLEKIFIPFFTTKSEGSGIGLSLARQIIQLHNGRIHAFTNSFGGLTVEIKL